MSTVQKLGHKDLPSQEIASFLRDCICSSLKVVLRAGGGERSGDGRGRLQRRLEERYRCCLVCMP